MKQSEGSNSSSEPVQVPEHDQPEEGNGSHFPEMEDGRPAMSAEEAARIERRAEAYQAAARYCAYQDRCTREVSRRLQKYELQDDDLSAVLQRLRDEQWLDDERFARSYSRGKFRIKGWGRNRIRKELSVRGIASETIEAGLAEIERDSYRDMLSSRLRKYSKTVRTKDPYEFRARLSRWAAGRGYETALVREVVDELIRESNGAAG